MLFNFIKKTFIEIYTLLQGYTLVTPCLCYLF